MGNTANSLLASAEEKLRKPKAEKFDIDALLNAAEERIRSSAAQEVEAEVTGKPAPLPKTDMQTSLLGTVGSLLPKRETASAAPQADPQPPAPSRAPKVPLLRPRGLAPDLTEQGRTAAAEATPEKVEERMQRLDQVRVWTNDLVRKIDEQASKIKPPKLDPIAQAEYEAQGVEPPKDPEIERFAVAKKVATRVLRMDPRDTGLLQGLKRATAEPEKLLPFLGSIFEAKDLLSVLSTIRKEDRGEKLTPGEDALLNAYAAQISALRDFDPGILDKAAQVAVGIPAFAAEFAATSGVYGGGKKAAEKLFEKLAIRGLEKGLAGKAVAATAGGLAQTAALAPTSVTRGAIERMIPQMSLAEDKELGTLSRQADAKGDDFLKAVTKEFGAQAVEVLSERTGGAVNVVLDPLKKTLLKRWATQKGVSATGEALGKLAEKAGWNGILGEIFEEQVAKPFRSAIEGDPLLKDFTLENFAVEVLGFSLFGGAAKGVGYGVDRLGKAAERTQGQATTPPTAAPTARRETTPLATPGAAEQRPTAAPEPRQAAPTPAPAPRARVPLRKPEQVAPPTAVEPEPERKAAPPTAAEPQEAPAPVQETPVQSTEQQAAEMRQNAQRIIEERRNKRLAEEEVPADAVPTPPEASSKGPDAAPTPDFKALVTAGGGQFVGIQEGAGKVPESVLFNDPETRSTLMVPSAEITEEKVKERIAESRAKFAAAKSGNAGNQGTTETPQIPEKLSTPAPDTSEQKPAEVAQVSAPLKKPGEKHSVMGLKDAVARAVKIDQNNIVHELYESPGSGEGVVRVYDQDSGEVVSTKKWPTYAEARAEYEKVPAKKARGGDEGLPPRQFSENDRVTYKGKEWTVDKSFRGLIGTPGSIREFVTLRSDTGEILEEIDASTGKVLKVKPDASQKPVRVPISKPKKFDVNQVRAGDTISHADSTNRRSKSEVRVVKRDDGGRVVAVFDAANNEIPAEYITGITEAWEHKSVEQAAAQIPPTREAQEAGAEKPRVPISRPKPVDTSATIESEATEAADVAQQPTQRVGTPSDRALEGTPPEAVPSPEVERDAGRGRGERGDADAGRAGRSSEQGDGSPSGVGEREGELAVSPERGGRAESGREPGQVSRPDQSLNDYRITDADRVGEGSIKQKYEANVSAIETLKALEAEGRLATPEEQQKLVKYVGWGGMPQAFDIYRRDDEWARRRDQLQELLSEEEYAAARASTTNAHYTSPEVIKGVWAALSRMGFDAGRVLEPSAGVGHFFGLMPAESAIESRKTGVELDPITGRILKQLYQSADVRIQGFETFKVPDGFYDVVVGNVPFGDFKLHDPKYNKYNLSIHNYFILKSLDKLRPGGVAALITSSFTMDAVNPSARKLFAERADLIGAIRLPYTAFKDNANTEVVTDILFFKKRAADEKQGGEAFIDRGEVNDPKTKLPISVNEYFSKHPEMMVGTMALEGSQYRANEPTLLPEEGKPIEEGLAERVAKLPENAMVPREAPKSATVEAAEEAIPEVGETKPFGLKIKDGKVYQRQGDMLVHLDKYPKSSVSRLKDALRVRDAVRELLGGEVADRGEAELREMRKRLNRFYDEFVKRNGYISEKPNVRAMAEDPDLPLLLSLEHYDTATKKGSKADIFFKKTIAPRRPVERVETAKEGLVVTLAERGKLDFAHMRKLTGLSDKELQTQLKEQGLVFNNPQGYYETSDAYLSGNVREKLREAEDAAKADPQFKPNVEALKKVQPRELDAGEIAVRLGAPWIPADDVAGFIAHILDVPKYNVTVGHIEDQALWKISLRAGDRSVENTKTWGTPRMPASDIIELALSQKLPTVYDRIVIDGKEKSVVNEKETLAARDKAEKIEAEFKKWIFQDTARGTRLAQIYNERYNSHQLRQYDGSHLMLPGASANITLRPHQKHAIWRMLQGGNVGLFHVVGAGKTWTIVGGAMEMRRIGLAKKPMVVVPNHLVEQWGGDFLRLYPGAKVLVATKEDFVKGKRQQLMSRIATGDWDAVVVAHSSFKFLPISDENFNAFMHEQIAQLEEHIRTVKSQRGETSGRLVKELEKAKARLKEKINKRAQREAKDVTVTFEELGVDALFVDEAHLFKNLFFPTRMTRVSGIPQTESDRAFDMFMKARHVSRMNNGRGVVFATGTPISNTMAEMFTMQRYLDEDSLKAQGMGHFDSWAGNFGLSQQNFEVRPEDPTKFRVHTRFSKFVNLPELLTAFRGFADVKTAEDLNLPVPKLAGGKPNVVVVPISARVKAYIKDLGRRADALRGIGYDEQGKKISVSPPDPTEDNMLKITNDGRKAALDFRTVYPDARDEDTTKINEAVRNITRIWEAGKEQKLTQAVMLDLAVPSEGNKKRGGFNAYQDIKNKLIANGVPKEEIAFIHDAENDEQKQSLFDKVNAGKVRVIIGSTEKMGVGTNIQKLLKALHHLDSPWRPSDIEQREGRILRQGNSNEEVEIYRYVTEETFDAYMWQVIETKAKFINQIMRGDLSVREAEDVDGRALSYAEAKALATGNPVVTEKVKVDLELRKLQQLAAAHESENFNARRQAARIPEEIAAAKQEIIGLKKDLETRNANKTEEFRMTVDGKLFTDRKEAGAALNEAVAKNSNATVFTDKEHKLIGEFAGFKLRVRGLSSIANDGYAEGVYRHFFDPNFENPLGTVQSLEAKLRNIEGRISEKQDKISTMQSDAVKLEAEIGKPFDKQPQLEALTAKQKELEKVLQLDESEKGAQVAAASDQEEGTLPEGPVGEGPGTPKKGQTDITGGPIKQLAGAIDTSRRLGKRVPIVRVAKQAGLDAKGEISRGFANMKAATAKLWSMYSKPPAWDEFKALLGRFTFIEQKAAHETRQFVKALKKATPSPIRREGITNWIEAGGDEDKLRERKAAVPERYRAGYQAALELNDDEITIARNIRNYQDERLERDIKAGLLEQGVDDYVHHVWKKPPGDVRVAQAEVSLGKLQPNPSFAKRRVFETFAEGEAAGYEPKTKDIASLIEIRERAANRAIASRGFIRSLLNGEAKDGRPLAAVSGGGSTLPGGEEPADAYLIRPKTKPDDAEDYRPVDHPALRKWVWATKDDSGNPIFVQGDMLIHPDHWKQVRNMLGSSAIRRNPFGRAVLKGIGAFKHVLLSFSAFHQVQEGLHAVFHRVNPMGAPQIDFDNEEQRKLVEHGLMIASYDHMEAFSEGLYSTALTEKIPGIGPLLQKYGNWLFHDYIPRLKIAMAREALERNEKRYKGKLDEDQIYELTASQANAAFGELNYDWMGRNRTTQDVLRLMFLAPDFLEARARFVGQSLKPYGAEQAVALYIVGALGMYVIFRILNKLFDDDYHFDRPFSMIVKGRELTPRTVPGDIYHLVADPRNFAYHRLNPTLVRPGIEALTGRDALGRKRDVAQQFKDWILGHVPIPLQALTDDRDRHIWESLLNSIGISEFEYRSAAQKKASALIRDRLPAGQATKEQEEEYRLIRRFREKVKQGEVKREDLKQLFDALGPKRFKNVVKGSQMSDLERSFRPLELREALEVWDVATEQERATLRPILERKAQLLNDLPEGEKRAELAQRVRVALSNQPKYRFPIQRPSVQAAPERRP